MNIKRTITSFLFIVMLGFPLLNFAQEVVVKPQSRIVEDGGTGQFKAIMLSESTLSTHTVFRPNDLKSLLNVHLHQK